MPSRGLEISVQYLANICPWTLMDGLG